MSSPNPEGDKSNDQPYTEKRTAKYKARPTSPLGEIPRAPIDKPPNGDQHRAKEEIYWEWQTFWQKVTALSAIGAFVAATIYACFAHQQVTESQRLAVSAHDQVVEAGNANKIASEVAEAARDSAAAAKVAAQSAEATNRISQETLAITESPYVYNKSEILNPLKVGQRATVSIEIVNIGKLAAENFIETGGVELRTSPPSTVNVNLVGPIKRTQLLPLIPKRVTVSTVDPINKDQLQAIRNGTLTLFVYGAIIYQTPFVQKEPTARSYCASYDPHYGLGLVGCDPVPWVLINGIPVHPKAGP